MSEPLRICVTGAAGQIAYSLIYMIAKGDVFGKNQPLIITLLDIEKMLGVLDGVVMEVNDCAFPLLQEVIPTADVKVAFKDISVAFLVGAMPRREGMERKDLLAANVNIFKAQGIALDQYAKKDVKVIVVGNPANTNAFICAKYAPSIKRENFTAMTRLDQNRATSLVAHRVGVPAQSVMNVVIWGNHSSTQYPDVSHATVKAKDGKTVGAKEAVKDDTWLKNEFITTVQKRGGAVLKARQLSSAMSAAKACCDHVRDWWTGIPEGSYISMAVPSDGSYDIDDGIVYSFPVKTNPDHTYTIVKGLKNDDFSRAKMDETLKELREERDMALSTCK